MTGSPTVSEIHLLLIHLEYCCQIWNPNYNKDIDSVEGVQRRATKLITSMQNLSCDDICLLYTSDAADE